MTGVAPELLPPTAETPSSAAIAALLNESRISPLWGAFSDPALEAEFRESSRDEWARRVAAVSIIASVLLLGFGYVDWQVLGPGTDLAVMWSGRALVLALGVTLAFLVRRARSVATLDHAALALMLGITGIVLLVVGVQRKSILFETPATVLGVIGFYLFIPTRLSLQAACGALLGSVFIAAHAAWSSPSSAARASAVTQLVLGNGLGFYTAMRNHALLRREFLALRQARRMATDETRRKEELQSSVAALERSNQELEQYAYVASHDLQAPLRSMISFAQLLQRRFQGAIDEKGAGYIDTIVQSGAYMQRLITDLLAFSRVGHSGLPAVHVDTGTILAQVEYQLATQVREKQARVTHDTLPTLPGAPIEILQLFQNLLDNALKFQSAGTPPRIHFSARRNRTGWEFSVRDNGIGIDHEHRERIFRIFQRLHDARSYEGTGIGLAICQKIVEQHGGRIWVESTPGNGSTFFFTLPSAYQQAFPPAG